MPPPPDATSTGLHEHITTSLMRTSGGCGGGGDSPPETNTPCGGGNGPSSEGEDAEAYEAPPMYVWGTSISVQDVNAEILRFLKHFREHPLHDEGKYMKAIDSVIEMEGESHEVDTNDVFDYDNDLYTKMVRYPLEVLAIFDIVLMDMVSRINPLFEKHIQARIFNLKSSTYSEKMVSLKGMIIRCSSIIPEIREAVFRCLVCGHFSETLLEELKQRSGNSELYLTDLRNAAYSRVGEFEEVVCLFEMMQELGVRPNESVLVSVLTACGNIGALAQGLWVHSYAKRYHLDSNTILATALVDMYSKCGYPDLALSVFNSISVKDTGAWNAIISGLSMNGKARTSLDLLNQMASVKIQPSAATFVALLTACTHAKLVKEEREAMEFMENKLGGIGKGDANVWGALLGVCRTYGMVEIGNKVWRKLVEMKVSDYGVCVVSYNMYKEAGWKREAEEVRNMISESGLKKTPGCSAVEVDGVVREFVSGDNTHYLTQEIHKTLDSL
ncbi:Pentatricopeptide repeat-containing protein [Artemisia annua]|uniref:Pentatricopeptide repeat-containing protein n=1 Tax=Artemisia annua TaxID=35608 RepID=A0A2U1PYR6_ARTAN|nr:Pentatricopeptide repeat-containing protein [Artemisia annua]